MNGVVAMNMDAAEASFWTRVEKDTACWLWQGSVGSTGYGTFRGLAAHRFAYEAMVGPIPVGLVLDHACKVPRCVRPDHLEAVSQAENLRRGVGFPARQASQTHCVRGHAFDEANTYRWRGHRMCKTCKNERRRKHLTAAQRSELARRAAQVRWGV
jgi:hypothetical protein